MPHIPRPHQREEDVSSEDERLRDNQDCDNNGEQEPHDLGSCSRRGGRRAASWPEGLEHDGYGM